MKNIPNLEKHPLRKGVYIAYDATGQAHRVAKTSFGHWDAKLGQTFRRLEDIAARIAKIGS